MSRKFRDLQGKTITRLTTLTHLLALEVILRSELVFCLGQGITNIRAQAFT